MNKFVFKEEAPKHWNGLCLSLGDMFNNVEWQYVLSQGFGSKTLYGWDADNSIGITITVFKTGPFRIGYLGFPVGGMIGSDIINNNMLDALKETCSAYGIHIIRVPISSFADSAYYNHPVKTTMETVIENLQKWRSESLSHNLQRSIRKAQHSPLKIMDASESSQGQILYRLYHKTILMHGGNLRYTGKYFSALIDLALSKNNLRCILAIADGEIAGFLVVACHGSTAYDMHCCIDRKFKKYAPSDLLTDYSITWAREEGMERYNLMASPRHQKSLIKYKEKWGGITKEQKVYELDLKPLQAVIIRSSINVYQRVSRLMS